MEVKLSDKYVSTFISRDDLEGIRPRIESAHKKVLEKNGAGSGFLGWRDLPVDHDKDEYQRIWH